MDVRYCHYVQENIKASAWCSFRALLCYGPFPQTQNIQTRVVLVPPCPSQASLPPHFRQWHHCSSCSGPASSESLVILPHLLCPPPDTRVRHQKVLLLLFSPAWDSYSWTHTHFALVLSCHSLLPEPPVDSPGFGNWCLPFSVRAHLS